MRSTDIAAAALAEVGVKASAVDENYLRFDFNTDPAVVLRAVNIGRQAIGREQFADVPTMIASLITKGANQSDMLVWTHLWGYRIEVA